jgi:hypothetical protein
MASNWTLCELQDVMWRNYIWVDICANTNSLDSATRNIFEYTESLVTNVVNINRCMDECATRMSSSTEGLYQTPVINRENFTHFTYISPCSNAEHMKVKHV